MTTTMIPSVVLRQRHQRARQDGAKWACELCRQRVGELDEKGGRGRMGFVALRYPGGWRKQAALYRAICLRCWASLHQVLEQMTVRGRLKAEGAPEVVEEADDVRVACRCVEHGQRQRPYLDEFCMTCGGTLPTFLAVHHLTAEEP